LNYLVFFTYIISCIVQSDWACLLIITNNILKVFNSIYITVMQQIMYLIFSYLLIYVTSSLQLYNHRTSILNNPNWMALLDNGIPLRKLSIIGSHSTMSQGTWGDAFQTQSNSLTKQMTMGMRALDIRCRHMNNQLKIYDRIIYLNTDLAGVLTTVRSYLQTYTM